MNIGDIIIVKAGEKIPLDGVVVEDILFKYIGFNGRVRAQGALSPAKRSLSGCINLNGLLRVKVTKEFGESTVAKIFRFGRKLQQQKQNQKTLLPNLPDIILRWWLSERCCWQSFRVDLRRLERLDRQSVDLPGHFLPVRFSYFYSPSAFSVESEEL